VKIIYFRFISLNKSSSKKFDFCPASSTNKQKADTPERGFLFSGYRCKLAYIRKTKNKKTRRSLVSAFYLQNGNKGINEPPIDGEHPRQPLEVEAEAEVEVETLTLTLTTNV